MKDLLAAQGMTQVPARDIPSLSSGDAPAPGLAKDHNSTPWAPNSPWRAPCRRAGVNTRHGRASRAGNRKTLWPGHFHRRRSLATKARRRVFVERPRRPPPVDLRNRHDSRPARHHFLDQIPADKPRAVPSLGDERLIVEIDGREDAFQRASNSQMFDECARIDALDADHFRGDEKVVERLRRAKVARSATKFAT